MLTDFDKINFNEIHQLLLKEQFNKIFPLDMVDIKRLVSYNLNEQKIWDHRLNRDQRSPLAAQCNKDLDTIIRTLIDIGIIIPNTHDSMCKIAR